MTNSSPQGQPEFIRQLIAEFHARREAGEPLTQEQFLEEHSEYSTLLRQQFAKMDSQSDIGETLVHSPDTDDESTSLQTVVHGTNDAETSNTV